MTNEPEEAVFEEDSDLDTTCVLAYPRSMMHIPTRGIVFNPMMVRHFSEPQFLNRRQLSGNPQFKKLVPFVILFNDEKVAVFSDGKDKYTLGICDVVTDDDGDYMSGLVRIMNEQLTIASVSVPDSRVLGVINDESTPAGRTYLGVLHTIHYPPINQLDPSIAGVKRKMIGFCNLEQLLTCGDSFDPWSKLCIENFEILKIPQMGIPL